MNTSPLTPKQEKFVQELIRGKSQRQAYIAAGYSTEQMSVNTIDRRACELCHNVKVAARLDDLQQDAAAEAVISRAELLLELKAIALSDLTSYVNIVGRRVVLTPTVDMPKAKRSALQSLKEGRDGIEVKLHDKIRAIDILLSAIDGTDTGSGEDDGFIEAMKGTAKDCWSSDDENDE